MSHAKREHGSRGWQAQPALRGASRRKTLRTQRREIRELLKPSPSLGRDAYPDTLKDAVDETGLPVENFPSRCPYAPDAVLDENHLPEASF